MDLEVNIQCCGIKELDGVEDMENVVDEMVGIAEKCFDEDRDIEACPAFIFFSTTKGSNGEKIAEFIKKNGLGEVIKMRPRKNLGSGNMLSMWTWGINKKNFKLFWLQKSTDDLEDED